MLMYEATRQRLILKINSYPHRVDFYGIYGPALADYHMLFGLPSSCLCSCSLQVLCQPVEASGSQSFLRLELCVSEHSAGDVRRMYL